MPEQPTPVAWQNGRIVPLADATVHVHDLGLHGVAVSELLRTYNHDVFRLDDHLDRLTQSLELARLDEVNRESVAAAVAEIVSHNSAMISSNDDLAVVVFVTAGESPTYAGTSVNRDPTVCVHTFPLPFELWDEPLRSGLHLVTPTTRALPPGCIDSRIKSRSRLHWHIANREAHERDPSAVALLIDADGFVTETASANLFIVRKGELFTPPEGTTLGGVSQRVVRELGDNLGVAAHEQRLSVDDVLSADEVFTTSTPYGLLPVSKLNGVPIGTAAGCDFAPGPMFLQLLDDWSQMTGVNIGKQIKRCAEERRSNSS